MNDLDLIRTMRQSMFNNAGSVLGKLLSEDGVKVYEVKLDGTSPRMVEKSPKDTETLLKSLKKNILGENPTLLDDHKCNGCKFDYVEDGKHYCNQPIASDCCGCVKDTEVELPNTEQKNDFDYEHSEVSPKPDTETTVSYVSTANPTNDILTALRDPKVRNELVSIIKEAISESNADLIKRLLIR